MSVGASGDNEPRPIDSTRPEPTLPIEPTLPVDPGYADYPTASVYPVGGIDPGSAYPSAFSGPAAQYPPPYPDLGDRAKPATFPPPIYSPYTSYPQYGYPARRQTNTLAIVALVISFFFWPAGLVCAHIARNQIARSGESGRGLTTVALVIGYVQLAFIALLFFAGIAII